MPIRLFPREALGIRHSDPDGYRDQNDILSTRTLSGLRLINSILTLVIVLTQLSTSLAQDWKLSKEENGISIYLKKSTTTGLNEVKATMTLKTTLSSIVALGLITELYPTWSYRVDHAKILEKVNDTAYYGYTLLDVPWPASDRDMVWFLQYTQDPITKIVRSYSSMRPDHIPVNKGVVRVQKAKAGWILTPTENGEVFVEYEFSFEPGGYAPAWIVNLGSDQGPFHNFSRIKEVIHEAVYQDLEVGFIEEP